MILLLSKKARPDAPGITRRSVFPAAASSAPPRLAFMFAPTDNVASTEAIPRPTPSIVAELRQGWRARLRIARRSKILMISSLLYKAIGTYTKS